MKTLDWIRNEIMANGLLCEEYTERVRNAKSKKQLFEICCDANGARFLPEMRAKGYPLDYDVIHEEFFGDLSKYKIIILPSAMAIAPGFAEKLSGTVTVSDGACRYAIYGKERKEPGAGDWTESSVF